MYSRRREIQEPARQRPVGRDTPHPRLRRLLPVPEQKPGEFVGSPTPARMLGDGRDGEPGAEGGEKAARQRSTEERHERPERSNPYRYNQLPHGRPPPS